MDMRESIEGLFANYRDSNFVLRQENYALWTIPSVFPHNHLHPNTKKIGNSEIQHDYQSIGAILTNSLATKLASVLFPAGQSFFRMNLNKELESVLKRTKGFDYQNLQSDMVETERKACSRLFLNASYAQLIQMLRYLIITGNALIKRHEGKITVYSIHNYSILRDNSATVLDIVLRETFTYGSLPKEIKEHLGVSDTYKKDTDEVTVFTRIKRATRGSAKKERVVYEVTKEIGGQEIGKQAVYPERLCPYIPVAWNVVNGDSYGHSHVEDYAGDFAKLSDLSRALTLYQIDACKVVNLVKPGATVDLDSLNAAEIGEWVQADPNAVGKHEGGEYQKIKAIADDIQSIFSRLSQAFMYSGNVRDAERVTAEEIRMNAEEADKALGGVYSRLAECIHLPLAYLLTYEVQPTVISAFVSKEIDLEILTGLSALGRTAEINGLIQATQVLAAIVPALKQVSARFDTELIVDRVLQAHGVSPKDYMLTPEALQKQTNANQQAMQQLDPLNTTQAIQGVM